MIGVSGFCPRVKHGTIKKRPILNNNCALYIDLKNLKYQYFDRYHKI